MKWTDGLSKPGVLAALGAALLFGAGTPLASSSSACRLLAASVR